MSASSSIKYQPDEIDPKEFDFVMTKIREYYKSRGLIEASVQQRRTILAACEDPKTISIYNHGGMIWPLPQTGQMNLEDLLLKNPGEVGYSTLTYSYRNEPDPVEGRHQLIFPLSEFEVKATTDNPMRELIDFEIGLLGHLGFDTSQAVVIEWEEAAKRLGVEDIDHAAEMRIWKEISPITFLTNFPIHTEPFWNMKLNDDGKTAVKVDCILYGQETFGSAVRSSNKEEMLERFETVSGGEYASLLYSHFTKERVRDGEMCDYLSLPFIPRYGGGMGVTRGLRAMRLADLLTM